jgi:chromosome partitioning protein
VQAQERAFKRKIRYSVLFTRTSAAIRSRTFQSIEAQFRERQIPVLNTQIIEREAYRALFAFGGNLSSLDAAQVSNIPAAIMNARIFSNEILAMLKADTKQARAAEMA